MAFGGSFEEARQTGVEVGSRHAAVDEGNEAVSQGEAIVEDEANLDELVRDTAHLHVDAASIFEGHAAAIFEHQVLHSNAAFDDQKSMVSPHAASQANSPLGQGGARCAQSPLTTDDVTVPRGLLLYNAERRRHCRC